MRICREFENWSALSGKFLLQKSCYPESFCFLWLWETNTPIFLFHSSGLTVSQLFNSKEVKPSQQYWEAPLYLPVTCKVFLSIIPIWLEGIVFNLARSKGSLSLCAVDLKDVSFNQSNLQFSLEALSENKQGQTWLMTSLVGVVKVCR